VILAGLTTAVLALMFAWTAGVAHEFADHIAGQTDKIADNKAKPGKLGWSHIVQHVFWYHLVMIVMLLLVIAVFNLPVSIFGFVTSVLFSAVTHAFIDRRWPVKWLLQKTRSPNFAEMQTPLCGMYLADQSLHKLALWVSAILFAVL
jgi:hypothetical protein